MIEQRQEIRMPPIGFTLPAYRAYLQMSHRTHLLVGDAREKMSAALGLEEIAGEIEQEIDVDIDSAEFFLSPNDPFIRRDMVEQIYSDLRATLCATKLVRFEELAQQFPSNSSGGDDGGDKDLDSRVQRTFRQLTSNGVILAEPAAVRYYLLRHQDLIELLPRVADICLAQFDGQAQLSLELYSDPEVVDSYLAIYLRQDNYQENVVDLIQKAREAYSQFLARSSGWILLTTDFDSPR